MEKRYQIFVSSTYRDLAQARGEVMQALLELDCFPAGMELFPAANAEQWEWIKHTIDESDYYLLILAGRYGTISKSTGKSYTEMEYEYALSVGKPVIAFIHENPDKLPAEHCEQDAETLEKLNNFRELLRKRLCKMWSSASDLGGKVSRALPHLIKQNPAVGWVRASHLPIARAFGNAGASAGAAKDVAVEGAAKVNGVAGKKAHASTETDLSADPGGKSAATSPQEAQSLAQGPDRFDIAYGFNQYERREKNGRNFWVKVQSCAACVPLSWDEIFKYISTSLIGGLDEWKLAHVLDQLVVHFTFSGLQKQHPDYKIDEFCMTRESKKTILVQLRALGLICCKTQKQKTLWHLTPRGDKHMTRLIAVQKS